IPFSLMHIATFNHGRYSWQICLGCLFLLWASDTGAYFAGKNFGKTKLFPR
ncbi:MAG TPA: phosphatidate cytidylyltransferase, partial [Cytophagales bacterium]|nr:phosphatidate cytidylyltransferase [Cytophagales bacterium]